VLKQNPIKPGSSTLEPELGAAPMPAFSIIPEHNTKKDTVSGKNWCFNKSLIKTKYWNCGKKGEAFGT
jgi:hypothetical protein